MTAQSFPLDADSLDDAEAKGAYRRPPDLTFPTRGALVVGARGSGKTILLRTIKADHDGRAIRINVLGTLGQIARVHSAGALAGDRTEGEQSQILGRTRALIAIEIANRMLHDGRSPDDSLAYAIPSTLRSSLDLKSKGGLMDALAVLEQAPPDLFRWVDQQALSEFVIRTGESCKQSVGPLLLLFDKVDQVAPQCLWPLVELLDQAEGFRAIVAIRPGQDTSLAPATGSIPGDHFDVVHLGCTPNSSSWFEFACNTVRAHFQRLDRPVPPDEIVQWTMTLARDSFRVALNILEVWVQLERRPDGIRQGIRAAFDDMATGLRATSGGTVLNLRAFAQAVRARVESPRGHVRVSFRESKTIVLDHGSARVLNRCLRAGALCLPAGEKWAPGISIDRYEIPPMLLWKEGDPQWTSPDGVAHDIELSVASFRPQTTPQAQEKSVFVAFDFSETTLRTGLEAALRSTSHLRRFHLVDGKTGGGTEWAPEVRNRIKGASAVVVDLRTLSKEVLFEAGFGWAMRKPLIPVVERNAVEGLPRWLKALQLRFATSNVADIVSDLDAIIVNPPQQAKGSGLLHTRATWVGPLGALEGDRSRFSSATWNKGGSLAARVVDSRQEWTLDELRNVSLGACLVSVIQGTDGDLLQHFLCGAFVGASSRAKYRRALILLDGVSQDAVSDSVRRCDGVKVVEPGFLWDTLRDFAAGRPRSGPG